MVNVEEYNDLVEIGNLSTTRQVYKITGSELPPILSDFKHRKDIVVKICKGNRGYDANRQEFNVWRKTEDKNLFCPSYFLLNKGEILIMEKADTDYITDKDVEIFLDKYIRQYECSIRTDIKKSNIGRIDNNTVLIDYPFVPV